MLPGKTATAEYLAHPQILLCGVTSRLIYWYIVLPLLEDIHVCVTYRSHIAQNVKGLDFDIFEATQGQIE